MKYKVITNGVKFRIMYLRPRFLLKDKWTLAGERMDTGVETLYSNGEITAWRPYEFDLQSSARDKIKDLHRQHRSEKADQWRDC